MNALTRLFGFQHPRRYSDDERDELDEWARHHNDPRSGQGFDLYMQAMTTPQLSVKELRDLWQQANKLVGQRTPADYGEFLVYGYLQGRMDALRVGR